MGFEGSTPNLYIFNIFKFNVNEVSPVLMLHRMPVGLKTYPAILFFFFQLVVLAALSCGVYDLQYI